MLQPLLSHLAAAASSALPWALLAAPVVCKPQPTRCIPSPTLAIPGVVLTIEPGLYIPDDEAFGPFAGIGVRIEDDVAITGQHLQRCKWAVGAVLFGTVDHCPAPRTCMRPS